MPIQAGTLRLPVVSHRSTLPDVSTDRAAAWRPLASGDIDELDLGEDDSGLLQQLFADPKIGFSADCTAQEAFVTLRVYLLPVEEYERHQTGKRQDALRALFARLDRGWDEVQGPLLETEPDDLVGIKDIYKLIESPRDPVFEDTDDPNDAEVFGRFVDYENPPGVRTLLHRYQIRSVARMLKMEAQPGRMVDPHYVPVHESGTGRTYYLSPKSMEIRLDPPRHALSRGGILCEQMGVGKTLMCLALVVATRHQAVMPAPLAVSPSTGVAAPDPALAVDRLSPVVTDYAVRHHPHVGISDVRARACVSPAQTALRPAASFSLVDVCADVLATHAPHARRHPDLPPALRPRLDRRRLHYVFPPPPRLLRTAKRVHYESVERVWLADTTLVVVPEILVPQWAAEMDEHLEREALDAFVVDRKAGSLPPVEQLMMYDIVLMSVERFRLEARVDEDTGQFRTDLLQARWKRIILDEGNIANNTTSDAMRLADALSIERRWIVSGTPTTNLKQGTEDLSATATPRVSAEPMSLASSGQRRWTDADLSDVSRLGNMLRGFLAAEVFQMENFARLVTAPLRGSKPRYGAVARIRGIMSAVMVKHRPGVIEAEVALPPSTLVVRPLDFTRTQRLTYNALTALVASNVYTSAHSDVDYFLHPRNVAAFKQVVANLHLACTWFSSRDMELEAALERTLHVLDTDSAGGGRDDVAAGHDADADAGSGRPGPKPRKEPLTPAQRAGLEQAVRHMRAALDDAAWAEWMRQSGASMPFAVPALPAAVKDAWSDSPDARPDWVDAHALLCIRDLNAPGADAGDIVRAGWEERATKCEEFQKAMEGAEMLWRADMAKAGRPGELAPTAEGSVQAPGATAAVATATATAAASASAETSPVKAKAAAQQTNTPRLLKRKDQDKTASSVLPTSSRRRRVDSTLDRSLDEAERNARAAAQASAAARASDAPRPADAPRPLPPAIAARTESAKIDCALRAVLGADAADKFVVFGTFGEIAHLTEALALAGVGSTYVGAHVSPAARRAALAAFAGPRVRVCMLELRFAARGLTLTAANRMLFLAPVWSADVQAQAVKRIHRIGQTRPTTVEVLATRGTFEEDVAARGTAERGDDEERRYERHMIEVPRFVYREGDAGEGGEDGESAADGADTYPIQLALPDGDDADALLGGAADPGPSTLGTPTRPPGSPSTTSPADTELRTPATPDLAGALRVAHFAVAGESPGTARARPRKRARFADD